VTVTAERRLDVARGLHRSGVVENNAGRPLKAVRLLQRALAILDEPEVVDATPEQDRRRLRARIEISRAFSEYELSGLDRGLAVLSTISSDPTMRADPEIGIHLHLQEGFMRVRGGDFERSLEELDRAVALIEQADQAAGCNALVNRGMVHLYLGHIAAARTDFQQASDRAQKNGLVVENLKARHNLGCVEFYAGNLALALRIMDENSDVTVDVSSAVAYLDRAKVLIEAGLHREADESLVQAQGAFRAQRLWHDVGEVELARAECALLDGETLLARQLAGKARDRFRRRGNDAWRRQAELVLLQADLAAGRPGARLAPPARRLVVEFLDQGLGAQARLAQLIAADALLRAGRPGDARQVADNLTAQKFDPIAVRLYDFYVRAQLARAETDDGAARRNVRNGLNELAAYQASFGSIDLQSGSAVHGRRLADLDVEMALADGRPAALLEAVERGRATSTRLIPVESPADEEAAALLADLRRTVEVIRAAEAEPEPGDLRATRERVAELQQLLRARAWHTDGSRQAVRAPKAGRLLGELASAGCALLCYVQVGDQLHVLSAEPGRPLRRHALGAVEAIVELGRRARADLDVIAGGRLPGPLVAAVHKSLRRSLGELAAALIGPVGLGDEPVVIVPTGALATLPWGNLRPLLGRPVSVAPSGAAWLAARAPRADIVAAAGVSVEVFAGPGLVRADEEARAIARLWPGAVARTGAEARQEPMVAALAQATVVHVAAHGEHQAENPLFSALRLADGPVYAYELDQRAQAAEHVVLSACELGQATIRPGDEALGLTSALLHLGTRSVVAGVARVNDDVAAEVMIRYHAALSAGVDSARALADACAAEVELPAPFVCFGASWSPRRSVVDER
jgi:CHAT domain-containing protein